MREANSKDKGSADDVVEGELVHDDVFAIGERLADDLEAAAKTVGTFSGDLAEKGQKAAGKVRTAAGVGRVLASHYDEIKATVGSAVAAVEDKGIPVRDTFETLKKNVWKTTPLPDFKS